MCKTIYDGKIYDIKSMTSIASKDIFDLDKDDDDDDTAHIGMEHIGISKNGLFAEYRVMNKNNDTPLYYNYIQPIAKESIARAINGWSLTDAEIAKLVELGVITEA